MGTCEGSCTGCCGGCGKPGALELAGEEIALLRALGQLAFLPLARRADREEPVCFALAELMPDRAGLALLCLQKRGLVDLDYGTPLSGCGYEEYAGYPVRGSAGLTARGLQALEVLEILGAE